MDLKSLSIKKSIHSNTAFATKCAQSPVTLSCLVHWLSMQDEIMSEPAWWDQVYVKIMINHEWTSQMGSDETFDMEIFRLRKL